MPLCSLESKNPASPLVDLKRIYAKVLGVDFVEMSETATRAQNADGGVGPNHSGEPFGTDGD